MKTRTAGRWGAVAALSALLVVAFQVAPASACVCGVVTPDSDAKARVSATEAIVRWDGNHEVIDLAIAIDSDAASAGLIFPTPRPATVTAGDPDLFDAVREQAEPDVTIVDDWWGLGVEGQSPEPEEPVVLDTVRIGKLSATTLEASDSSGLGAWLKKNDYSISNAARDALRSYVDKGWSFVAVKLTDAPKKGEKEPAPLRGQLEPISIAFSSNELVYPMRVSGVSQAPQDMRLYVFDDHRVVLSQDDSPSKPVNAAQTTVWAGAVDKTKLSSLGDFLTVFDLHLDDPKSQSRSDLVVTDARADEEFIPSLVLANPITLLGIPVGLIVVGWGGFGLILGLAFITSRLRLR